MTAILSLCLKYDRSSHINSTSKKYGFFDSYPLSNVPHSIARKTLLCSAIPFRYVADEQSPAGGDHRFFQKMDPRKTVSSRFDFCNVVRWWSTNFAYIVSCVLLQGRIWKWCFPHLKSLLWTRKSWLQLKKLLTRERFWMRLKLAAPHRKWSKLQKLCKLQKLPRTQGWNQSIHKGDLAKGHWSSSIFSIYNYEVDWPGNCTYSSY